MSFIKGFMSLFDWFPESKSYDQLSDELDNSMQELYDKMNWGKYSYPNNNCSYISNNDIDRILVAKNIKDPARPRTSKNYTRQQYK